MHDFALVGLLRYYQLATTVTPCRISVRSMIRLGAGISSLGSSFTKAQCAYEKPALASGLDENKNTARTTLHQRCSEKKKPIRDQSRVREPGKNCVELLRARF